MGATILLLYLNFDRIRVFMDDYLRFLVKVIFRSLVSLGDQYEALSPYDLLSPTIPRI